MKTKTLIIAAVIFAVVGIGGTMYYKGWKTDQLTKEQEELTRKGESDKFLLELKHDKQSREGDMKLDLIGAGYTAAQADSIVNTY